MPDQDPLEDGRWDLPAVPQDRCGPIMSLVAVLAIALGVSVIMGAGAALMYLCVKLLK